MARYKFPYSSSVVSHQDHGQIATASESSRTASVCLIFPVMMTSLASRYYEFILAQGVLFGIACGMIFTPVVSIVGQDFTTRRALAMGVVHSGAFVGGTIFPIVLNHLLNGTSLGIG